MNEKEQIEKSEKENLPLYVLGKVDPISFQKGYFTFAGVDTQVYFRSNNNFNILGEVQNINIFVSNNNFNLKLNCLLLSDTENLFKKKIEQIIILAINEYGKEKYILYVNNPNISFSSNININTTVIEYELNINSYSGLINPSVEDVKDFIEFKRKIKGE